MDEWLYVLRWTTAKSRQASPALFVARAVFSVIHGLFVILRCVAIWWGVDWLMAAIEDPRQSGQMLTRLALLAGGLLATEAVGRQIAYWLGSRARFHLELLLRREFIAKSSELDLVEIEAAGQRDLLEEPSRPRIHSMRLIPANAPRTRTLAKLLLRGVGCEYVEEKAKKDVAPDRATRPTRWAGRSPIRMKRLHRNDRLPPRPTP